MWVSVIASKIPKVQFLDKTRASIFPYQNFIPTNIVVHIVFVVESVFPKDLEPILNDQEGPEYFFLSLNLI